MKKNHGGKRNGAGRKPSARKKTALFLYIYDDTLTFLGKDIAKEIGENAIYRKAKTLAGRKSVDNLA